MHKDRVVARVLRMKDPACPLWAQVPPDVKLLEHIFLEDFGGAPVTVTSGVLGR